MDRKLLHNKFENQFELQLENNQKAIITYRKNGNHLSLLHSEVPMSLRGQGIGKELVEKTFQTIEKEGYTATAHCSYVRTVAKRSDYWSKIIQH
ncbi:GNAT family N-acetyltransferase [Galbibacter mesophilus]|uniref:GNAT family N-acetyltransferase n=1 Tax=Galbibacter mesophilus TaxID=379069 RepID=UPI00191D4F03|nr:GNAT family N-acetyltransferase [Galbibacter mesophilus]MCM5664174.1 N-acetyltransferase [Galbibacter mesophilus]